MKFVTRPNPLRRAFRSWQPLPANRPPLLTFDDGPHVEYTSKVLDLLAQYRQTAIFFALGQNAEIHADLMRRIVFEGHAVGNHTQSHPPTNWFAFEAAERELTACQRAVKRATGFVPARVRYPRGHWSPPLAMAARKLGLSELGWTVDSGDWRIRDGSEAEIVARELIETVKAGDVVLLHDYHPGIVPILKSVLPVWAGKIWNCSPRLASAA